MTCCGLRINLGCGSNIIPGWDNSDDDVRQKIKTYGENTASTILIEHVLEHLTAPETLAFMDDAHRVLKTGGVLRICVPTLERITDMNHARDLIMGHGHLQCLDYHTLVWMSRVAGFKHSYATERKPCDGHHRVIDPDRDNLETLRMEVVK